MEAQLEHMTLAEWEKTRKRLLANLNAAKRVGDAQEIRLMLMEYDQHYKLKSKAL